MFGSRFKRSLIKRPKRVGPKKKMVGDMRYWLRKKPRRESEIRQDGRTHAYVVNSAFGLFRYCEKVANKRRLKKSA